MNHTATRHDESDEGDESGVLVALSEPTTIVARPSLLAWTRLAWAALGAALTVTLAPHLGPWAPWMMAPLVVSAAVASGPWSAATWALAGALVLDLLSPGAVVGLSAAPALAAAWVVSRAAAWWAASVWAPSTLGLLASLVMQLVSLALRAAQTGTFVLDIAHLAASGMTAALLTGLLAPAWVRWAHGQRVRGRA